MMGGDGDSLHLWRYIHVRPKGHCYQTDKECCICHILVRCHQISCCIDHPAVVVLMQLDVRTSNYHLCTCANIEYVCIVNGI